MKKNIKAPAENKEIDFLNPVQVARAGLKKSVEMLLAILGRKQNGMGSLKTENPREKDILTVTKDSVEQRRLLAQELALS